MINQYVPAGSPAFVTSSDGTRIAYERLGSGPSLVLIGGALNDRMSALPLARIMQNEFTVFVFDRRGRGDSNNPFPYSFNREVEDLEALIEEAGGSASVYGHSSGAILGLLGAVAGLKCTRLATYEPSYAVDKAGDENNTEMLDAVQKLVDAGQNDEAVLYWLRATGMPTARIEQMRGAPFWAGMVLKAPTLIYELRLKAAFGTALVPTEQLSKIAVPVKAFAGGLSPEWMRQASKSVAASVPSGQYVELPGQNHMVPEGVITPVLSDFLIPQT